jgi:hypothetical protein
MKKGIFLLLSIGLLFTVGCNNDDDTIAKTLLQAFDVALNTSNSIPAVTGRNETGNITMNLFDDNSLEFTITINNLAITDELIASHVHNGDVVSTGGIEITLVDAIDITYSGNTASGTVMLTAGQISSLQGDDVYVNVHSTEFPSGLVRGQIDKTISNAYNVALSPLNEVPPVMGRSEEGNAYFRLVGSDMYYKVVVTDLDATDAIIGGHIHEGSSTENGGVLIDLRITDNTQLDITKNITLSSVELDKVKNDELYVNIHSGKEPAGLLRGQIRKAL